MRKSIGYGAYDGFGYANEPQWGLFNPPQSLYKSDPTLYNSLYATNENLDEAYDKARAKKRAQQHPGLPNQVGPRKAWKRDIERKEVGAHNRLGEFGQLDGFSITALLIIGSIISVSIGAIARMSAYPGYKPPMGASADEKIKWKNAYMRHRDEWQWFDFLLIPWYFIPGILDIFSSEPLHSAEVSSLRRDVWKMKDNERVRKLVPSRKRKKKRKNRK